MLNFWLTICNKKGTARDLCTIPLSSIIYYTTMKKISTTTYYHPILWHRIRCTSRHTHTLCMPACPLPILGLFLHHDEFFLLLHFLHYIPKCNHHLFDDQPTLPLYQKLFRNRILPLQNTAVRHMPLLQPSFRKCPSSLC